jgi:predicted ATPase/class 3 adenylate cyclase
MPGTDERKPVTVLFADLAGSTDLATRHDAEALRALLSAFFEEMRHHIEAFGGTVEKFAGDAVMAVFGVPSVHEDDAERAVRAAVAMRDAVAQLNPMFEQEYGIRLVLRIGVATGEAVAASRPAREFMVTGEVPNLAARLQALGAPIAISEETYRLLGPLVDAERTGPHALKGFERPTAAWQVQGLRVAESKSRGIPGLTSPVVGRDRELATVRSCIEDLRRGRGQILTVVGEAGIGKSRVKIEVRDNLPEDVRWLEARCQSYAQNTSYTPVVEVLRAALGLAASEPQAIARTRLRVALRGLAGERTDQLIGALAHLLDIDLGAARPTAVPPDPQGLRSQLVLSARAVFEGLAHRGPVVVAIEDLHWADPASVELLTMLAELTDFHPVMILVTSRPETEGNAWTFRQHVERNYGHRLTDLRLAPLDEADSRRLADNLLRVSDLPPTIREAILARAEGNPFFLEEIIRALIEQGVLRREGERWRLGADVGHWPIPTTLRGVLAARIDRLPGPAKTLLQHASVVGRFFEYRTLAAVAGESAELDRALADLLRAELIREWARRPERQYIFKHALTQEAAYASILGEERKALHGRVARHLEDILGEAPEHAALLAHHWERAQEWEPALGHMLRAAARARALYARPEAVAFQWRAVELLTRMLDTPDRRAVFVDAVVQLLRLPGWGRTPAERQRGLELIEEATRLAGTLDDVDVAARAEALAAYGRRDEGRLQRALERTRSQAARAFATDLYHLYLGQVGRYDDALVQARRAIELHRGMGARFEEALTVNSGGRCWAARAGRLTESLSHAVRFRTMAAELDDARLRACRAMEAEPYIYSGRWEDAVRAAEESLPLAWEIGELSVVQFVSAWVGLAYLKLGRRDDARQTTDRALRWSESRLDSTAFGRTYLTVVSALSHLADGDLEAAIDSARRAIELAERNGFPLEQGAAHRALGDALAAAGRRVEAEASYGRSLQTLESIQSLPESGQTLLALGRFKLADDRAEGRRLVERARAIFDEIGATGWSREAETVLASVA